MSTDISVSSTKTYQAEKRNWLLSDHGTEYTPSITLDVSAFTKADHYPDGYIKSGIPLGKITATRLYGPYTGSQVNEVQSITEGGSGLTSFTLTFGGQTTSVLAAAATAAQVQAALEALSSIGTGNIAVAGVPSGPYQATFQGTLGHTNVAQMTATPTGGSGTVTVATVTAGGTDGASDGRDTAKGHLFSSVAVVSADGTVKTKVGGALLVHGAVDPLKVPQGIDANGQADCKLISYETY